MTATKPTVLVRDVLRAHGIHTRYGGHKIFTNKLKTGRTVKCYVSGLSEANRVSADIRKVLDAAGVVGYEFRTLPAFMLAPDDTLIVEIPYSAQPE